jgi:lysophospholipase L1-like esterase
MKQVFSLLLATFLALPAYAGHHSPFPVKHKTPFLPHHQRFTAQPVMPGQIPPLYNPPKVADWLQNDVVVFAGDSITALGTNPGGWCRQVAQWATTNNPQKNLQFYYSGVAGNRIGDIVKRLDTTILNYHPTTLILFIGINDADSYGFAGLSNFGRDLYYITARANQAGVQRILFMTPMVRGEKFEGENLRDPIIDAYANTIRTWCAQTGNPLLDIRQEIITYEYHYNYFDSPAGVFTIEGLHPNTNGQYLLAGSVLRAFGD